MPTSLPRRHEPRQSRFRRFMANSPPWFQWTALTAMFLAGLGLVIFYFWLVKTPPGAGGYAW